MTLKTISAVELDLLLSSGAAPFLLDVREPEEVAEDGAIVDSINIPMDDVERRLSEIPIDRDIVVICHLGARSACITTILNALGYDRAVNLRGGMEAWFKVASMR